MTAALRRALALVLCVVALAACERVAGWLGGDDDKVRAAYGRYRAAVTARDLAALKSTVIDARRAELDAPDAAAKLEIASALTPASARVSSVAIQGERATVNLTAAIEGVTATGVVELAKEGGAWKVGKETWSIRAGAAATPPPAAPPATEPPADAATPAPPPAAPAAEAGDATGELQLVKEGVALSYPLKAGFGKETRMKTPGTATLHFGPPVSPNSYHGVMLMLDATRVGPHYADGDEIRAAPAFGHDKIPLGPATTRGPRAALIYYAEGGQMFMPKTGCTIEITSPYTATDTSVLEGRIAECVVHSGGIDYTLASARFTVRGVSQR